MARLKFSIQEGDLEFFNLWALGGGWVEEGGGGRGEEGWGGWGGKGCLSVNLPALIWQKLAKNLPTSAQKLLKLAKINCFHFAAKF